MLERLQLAMNDMGDVVWTVVSLRDGNLDPRYRRDPFGAAAPHSVSRPRPGQQSAVPRHLGTQPSAVPASSRLSSFRAPGEPV